MFFLVGKSLYYTRFTPVAVEKQILRFIIRFSLSERARWLA